MKKSLIILSLVAASAFTTFADTKPLQVSGVTQNTAVVNHIPKLERVQAHGSIWGDAFRRLLGF